MYIHTCHDNVIVTALMFTITLGVTILGVGPMRVQKIFKATYTGTYSV